MEKSVYQVLDSLDRAERRATEEERLEVVHGASAVARLGDSTFYRRERSGSPAEKDSFPSHRLALYKEQAGASRHRSSRSPPSPGPHLSSRFRSRRPPAPSTPSTADLPAHQLCAHAYELHRRASSTPSRLRRQPAPAPATPTSPPPASVASSTAALPVTDRAAADLGFPSSQLPSPSSRPPPTVQSPRPTFQQTRAASAMETDDETPVRRTTTPLGRLDDQRAGCVLLPLAGPRRSSPSCESCGCSTR